MAMFLDKSKFIFILKFQVYLATIFTPLWRNSKWKTAFCWLDFSFFRQRLAAVNFAIPNPYFANNFFYSTSIVWLHWINPQLSFHFCFLCSNLLFLPLFSCSPNEACFDFAVFVLGIVDQEMFTLKNTSKLDHFENKCKYVVLHQSI